MTNIILLLFSLVVCIFCAIIFEISIYCLKRDRASHSCQIYLAEPMSLINVTCRSVISFWTAATMNCLDILGEGFFQDRASTQLILFRFTQVTIAAEIQEGNNYVISREHYSIILQLYIHKILIYAVIIFGLSVYLMILGCFFRNGKSLLSSDECNLGQYLCQFSLDSVLFFSSSPPLLSLLQDSAFYL